MNTLTAPRPFRIVRAGAAVFALVFALVFTAFVVDAPSASAASAGAPSASKNPLDNANPLCRFDAGCMSQAMCDKRNGELATCPELGNECAQPGWGLCYPAPTAIPLKIAIGGKTQVFDVGEYIAAAYTWAVGAAAVVAAVMLMVGGLQYVTSAGGGAVSAAKTRIQNALAGLGITVFAYLILNTINPALVTLVVPRIPMVPPQSFAECQEYQMLYQCGAPFGLREKAGSGGASVADRFEVVAIDDPGSLATCTGLSCSLAGKWDGTHTCVRKSGGERPKEIPKGVPVPPYECVGCFRNGESCNGLGPNEGCCGGFCGNKESDVGQLGGEAVEGLKEVSSEFKLAANVLKIGGSCTNGDNGINCAVDEECYGGHCVNITGTGGVCSSGAEGAICNGDDTCQNGLVCTDTRFFTGRCVRPGKDTLCFDDGDCSGLSCLPYMPEKTSLDEIAEYADLAAKAVRVLATPGGIGAVAVEEYFKEGAEKQFLFQMCGGANKSDLCDRDSDCDTGSICWRNLPDSIEPVSGDTGKGLCKVVAAGTFCKEDYDCRVPGGDDSLYCCKNCLTHMQLFNEFGICAKSKGGVGCDDDSQCQRSDDPNMARAICHDTEGYKMCTYPGIQGAPCYTDGGRDSCMKDPGGGRLICATTQNSGSEVMRCMPPNPNR